MSEFRKANFGSTTGPLPKGTRDDLDTSLRRHTISQPFTKALFTTNRRLGIHGDHSLDDMSAKRYATLAPRVESGEVSNSYAFGSSSWHWAKKGNFTGAFMNFMGMMASGPIDHAKYKTGKF